MDKKDCLQCGLPFSITREDRALLDHLSPKVNNQVFPLPDPTLCPNCRQQRRSAHINELNLYKRTCDFTGKPAISDLAPDSPYKVYSVDVWNADQWDPLSYGRDVDFSRPFFEQLDALWRAVPLPAVLPVGYFDENSAYTNYAGKNKNCYLVFDSDENRDCRYCYSLNGSRDCADCFRVRGSELCYECIDSYDCYGSSCLQDCSNCANSLFLKNCIGCRNCLMCSNLHNKEYHVENKPVSKEQFEQYVASLRSHSAYEAAKARFAEIAVQYPQRALHGLRNENVFGEYLTGCKNAYECFDCVDLWDCRHIYRSFMPVRDSMDCEAPGDGEKLYECSVVGYGANTVHFSANCLDQVSDLLYCNFCFHSSNLFGCMGLRRKQYCILNRQYTKDEYETLVPRIIEHMRRTPSTSSGQACEWGEFFPIGISPFPYNDSLAQNYYPLTQELALAQRYQWHEHDAKEYQPQTIAVPDAIDDVPDDIVNDLLACEACGKNYKIISQELAFYRQRQLPIPAHCFACRHAARMAKRNPRKLWERTCAQCGNAMQTTYAPERTEKVLCEQCYLQTVC